LLVPRHPLALRDKIPGPTNNPAYSLFSLLFSLEIVQFAESSPAALTWQPALCLDWLLGADGFSWRELCSSFKGSSQNSSQNAGYLNPINFGNKYELKNGAFVA